MNIDNFYKAGIKFCSIVIYKMSSFRILIDSSSSEDV